MRTLKGIPDAIRDVFKNAICDNCGARGKVKYVLQEDNSSGKHDWYSTCNTCGANRWVPGSIDEEKLLKKEY